MDLGKMLSDALNDSSSNVAAPNNIALPFGYFDLRAAAEAFLAKVRGAETAERNGRQEFLIEGHPTAEPIRGVGLNDPDVRMRIASLGITSEDIGYLVFRRGCDTFLPVQWIRLEDDLFSVSLVKVEQAMSRP